jgi:hypothetical protein
LKAAANDAAAKYKPLWHMLVLPKNETIHIPVFGGHPIGLGMVKPPKTARFGSSEVATELPPVKCWPNHLAPLHAVVAEQEFMPYRPLQAEPYRVHLFFGDGDGFQDFVVLCRDLVELADDLGRAVFRNASQSFWSGIIYAPGDCIHDDTAAILDR